MNQMYYIQKINKIVSFKGEIMIQHKFGLYEKALPRDLALSEKLRIAKDLGFDYFELSTDESEEFRARVTSDKSEIIEIRKAIEAYDMPIMTMCLSGTRNCPIGSENPELATKGMKLTMDAIHFSAEIGLRIIQPMAYDEYYNTRNEKTYALFLENLAKLTQEAASCGVMLALENVDIDTMDSLEKGLQIIEHVDSPWLQIFPDIANLYSTGKGNTWSCEQYRLAKKHLVATHVKDTVVGKVRDIPFGNGNVDFIKFFKTLREINFSGPMTLEMWAQNYEDPYKAAKDALSFIKDKYERSSQ